MSSFKAFSAPKPENLPKEEILARSAALLGILQEAQHKDASDTPEHLESISQAKERLEEEILALPSKMKRADTDPAVLEVAPRALLDVFTPCYNLIDWDARTLVETVLDESSQDSVRIWSPNTTPAYVEGSDVPMIDEPL